MHDADAPDEYEPLEIVPVAVPINAHDAGIGGPCVVRLFFRAGGYGWPGGGIADVLVIDNADHVSIGLLRRVVEGEDADGTMHGESLKLGGEVTLDVALSRPLGARNLLDASTGEFVPRVERPSSDPLPSEAKGTPLWRWS